MRWVYASVKPFRDPSYCAFWRVLNERLRYYECQASHRNEPPKVLRWLLGNFGYKSVKKALVFNLRSIPHVPRFILLRRLKTQEEITIQRENMDPVLDWCGMLGMGAQPTLRGPFCILMPRVISSFFPVFWRKQVRDLDFGAGPIIPIYLVNPRHSDLTVLSMRT